MESEGRTEKISSNQQTRRDEHGENLNGNVKDKAHMNQAKSRACWRMYLTMVGVVDVFDWIGRGRSEESEAEVEMSVNTTGRAKEKIPGKRKRVRVDSKQE